MSKYTAAIDKLKELSKRHEKLATELTSGEITIHDVDSEEIARLISTYNYWYQCCCIAAWLLENEEKNEVLQKN
jgi:hypothetical protein